jgi:hypothetical protein
MTYENYVKGKLVAFVVKEAFDGGSNEAMLAVAQVLANRVSEGWQGGDWLRVINTAQEFSGTRREEEMQPEPRDVTFRDLLRRIDDVYHGTEDDGNVNVEADQGKRKSMYYAWATNINVDWFKENILKDHENHPRLAQVGGLVFFG